MPKYNKSIRIFKPFFEKAFQVAKIDPSKVKRIVGYITPLNRDKQQSAQITYFKSGYYVISICLTESHYKNEGNRRFKKIKEAGHSLASILDSIAHEVSHIKNWEHDSYHLYLQAKILIAFSTMVKNLKITDTSKPYDKVLKETLDSRTIS